MYLTTLTITGKGEDVEKVRTEHSFAPRPPTLPPILTVFFYVGRYGLLTRLPERYCWTYLISYGGGGGVTLVVTMPDAASGMRPVV